jgi:oligosaccharide repeat unit polymerase
VTLWLATRADDAYFRSHWRTPKALTTSTAQLFLAAVLVFSFAAMWHLRRSNTVRIETSDHWPHLRTTEIDALERALGPLFWITLSGYLAMLISLARHGLTIPQLVRELLSTGDESGGTPLKEAFRNAALPGVTTLTQVGIAFVTVAVIVYTDRPSRRLRRRVIAILICALLRTMLNSERLALLELVVPAISVLAMQWRAHRRPSVRRVVRFAPFIFVPTLIIGFGLAEYSRSWVYYSAQPNQESFIEFTINRFTGYYTTSYNNGQLNLTYGDYPNRIPNKTLEALWRAPVISELKVYETLNGRDDDVHFNEVLRQHGNPEFNNSGGLAMPFLDYGTTGGLIFFALAGSAAGFLYRRFCRGDMVALLLYPVVVVGLFEVPRYLYWTTGRVIPAVLAVLVVSRYVRTQCGDAITVSSIGARRLQRADR